MAFKTSSLPTPFKGKQWYDANTLYQILLVEPNPECRDPNKILKKTLITQERQYFNTYQLSQKTQDNLKEYPTAKQEGEEIYEFAISSYLPSPGVVFKKGFTDELFKEQEGSTEAKDKRTININNFSEPMRTLLITRKISQLIAKTWDAYLEANLEAQPAGELKTFEKFRQGSWQEIDSKILDGLIAREIFLSGDKSEPDSLEPKNLAPYYPLTSKPEPVPQAKFIILPNNTAWQGIELSLLMAGQVYRKVPNNGTTYYHQISQPILSTGEIVTKYSLSVNFESFDGVIKELKLDRNKPSASFHGEVPYPPIPSKINLSHEDIKKWAYAEDLGGDIPFYIKYKDEDKNEDAFLIDVAYVAPPYPYLPMSCAS